MSELLATVVHDSGEEEVERSLRPRTLDDFVGQERVKEQLALLIEGARARGEPVDHLLFSGPPGLDLQLCFTDQADEIVQQWHDWAQVLGVPLLPAEQDNQPPARGPDATVRVEESCPRRRRRNAIKARRPSILMRRAPKRLDGEMAIYRGEHEIIARA